MILWHGDCPSLLVPITAVQQHPQNPNNGDVDVIAESILANGFFNPVVVQRSTGYILAGNHRYAALLSIGETDIPVIWADVDDERALRILIADNRTAEIAVRNNRELANLMALLEETDTGLVGTGYDEEGLAELRRLANIDDHAGFGAPSTTEPGDYDFQPSVTVYGRLYDGEMTPFLGGDIDEVVLELREHGFHAIGRSVD